MTCKMSAAERLLYFFGRPLVRCFYRVTPLGLENLPAGGFLLVPNHISWVDALILQLACPRPIRYVIDQEYYHKRMLHPILRAIGCIPISKRQSHAAVRVAAEKIAEGEIVCVFPEGELERRGTLLRLQRGYEVIARHAKAEVVPVWLDQLWGSIFSFQGGKFFRKFPKRIRYPVTVAFGKPLEAKAADVAIVREELLKLGEFCFSRRPSLNRHLAEDCVRGLKRRPFATAVVDGIDHTQLSRGKLLGAAAAFSRYLRKEFPDERIAIVLPASKGSMVANLAVMLANKVPVDLNFTIGRAANESCCRRANLRVAISATPFIERVKDFPWPEQRFEAGRASPAYEAPNCSLVDHVDDPTCAFAFAVTEHPEKGWARRSSVAFYKRNHWRTERRSNESPQRHGKCLAIPRTARCEENGRDSRVAAVLSHVWIDGYSLVSAHRRCAHRYVSESIGRGQMRWR